MIFLINPEFNNSTYPEECMIVRHHHQQFIFLYFRKYQAACGALRCTGNFLAVPKNVTYFNRFAPRAVARSALSLRLHLPAGCSARDPTSPPFASERAAPGLPRALPVAPPALQWRGVHGRDAWGSGELPLAFAARRCDGTRAFTGTPSYWRRRAPSSEKRAKTE